MEKRPRGNSESLLWNGFGPLHAFYKTGVGNEKTNYRCIEIISMEERTT